MTTYLAAYDVEQEQCHAALPRIVEMHERYAMPATFFIATHVLAGHKRELRALLGNPLFEIASHAHSHELLRAHPRSTAPPVPESALPEEVRGSKGRLEELFDCQVAGFRPPWGYSDGLKSCPRLLELLHEGGYRYASSLLWGPDATLPALIREPFSYREEGYPSLWEIPSCGWHENVAKTTTFMPYEQLMLPTSPIPEARLTRPLQTPEEEFTLNRVFLDRAIDMEARHVTLVWHPWSLGRFDPAMTMLELTFRYVGERHLPTATFRDYAALW